VGAASYDYDYYFCCCHRWSLPTSSYWKKLKLHGVPLPPKKGEARAPPYPNNTPPPENSVLLRSVAATQWGTGGTSPTFTNGLAWGTISRKKNIKQETGQTVLTTTKVLTITTNCTRGAKYSGGVRQIFSGTSRRTGAPPLSNSFRRH